MNFYEFLLRNRSEVFERSMEHIGLVGSSMAIALAVGLPLGVALVSRTKLQRWVIGAANVVQTIPSLALFGFLIPVPWIGGIGASTAIVAAFDVRPVAHSAEYMHRDRGGRSGGDRVRSRDGDDSEAGALASAIAAGRARFAGGDSSGDRDLHWHNHDCGRHRRRGPGSIYFSRTGNGQQPGHSGGRNSRRIPGHRGRFRIGIFPAEQRQEMSGSY